VTDVPPCKGLRLEEWYTADGGDKAETAEEGGYREVQMVGGHYREEKALKDSEVRG